uniref:Nucleotidyltransferase family protein n=1 Tax=Fervidicoccus fontis TaxID=683846 RepID=A0A7J3SJU7_9CREN
MDLNAKQHLLALLRAVGSPLALNQPQVDGRTENSYVPELYSMAEANKIPLTYLNTVSSDEKRNLPEYNYHYTRLRRLLEMISEISELFDREGIDYVIFKTLRPYPEDVSDIDVLNLGSRRDYEKMVEILRRAGYIFMERGSYCTTFQDYKTRFKTELMIDIYDEISVGYLIYLDKRKLSRYVSEKELPTGQIVRVFSPEAELLATIAHSAIKENQYILAEYFATLHYLALMDQPSIEELIDIVRGNKLVNAFRWHLTITLLLHKEAHGKIPQKLSNLLSDLGGLWSSSCKVISEGIPPYRIDSLSLAKIFKEKLYDHTFRRSLSNQFKSPNRAFTVRALERLYRLL